MAVQTLTRDDERVHRAQPTRFLSEVAQFEHSAPLAGSVQYHGGRAGQESTTEVAK